MKRARRTKIVATLGPASEDPAVIEALFAAGADVFRINMSHLPRERLSERVATIRSIEQKLKRPIAVLVDLQGPKLRVGRFAADAAMIENGQDFVLDDDPTPGDATRVHLPHPEILSALEPGHAVIVDDGKLRLVVTEVAPGRAVTRVVTGGKISNRKGVSLPDTTIPVAAMTEKDRLDLEAGLAAGADWIAVSFVQRPEDVAEVKAVAQGRALVMAKIEKPQAVTALDAIMAVADGLMVARGDLGVEMPLEQVPGVQKRITRGARRLGKPVVVATQMLDSMVHSPTPTRAEASDVATAVYDGADAVMLSAETAVGEYSAEAVAMMDRIIYRVERDPLYRKIMEAERHAPEATAADAITAAARQVAGTVAAAAVVTFTSTGSTTFRAARERPNVPILGLTPNPATARLLAMVWGVHPVLTRELHSFAEMVDDATRVASEEGFAGPGERLVITAGVPFGTPGATNILRIAWVE